MNKVMIDIETLGTTPGSVILSIGAVTFDADGVGAKFYATIDTQSCIDAGLTIDVATFKWWMSQADTAREAAFKGEHRLHKALSMLRDWFLGVEGQQVWCHGAAFDVPLLESAYVASRIKFPWDFHNVRCTRTLYDLAGVKVDRTKGTHHNALDDAIAQAEAAGKALSKFHA